MSLFFAITLPAGTSEATGEALAADRQESWLVEEAYRDPTPEDADAGEMEKPTGTGY